MAILDAGPYQAWIAAFDNWERAQRRFNAAGRVANNKLTEYLRGDLDRFTDEYNAAVKALKNADYG